VSARGRIVVAGRAFDVAGQAGASWAVLQYVLGLRELGYEVWLLEPVAGLDPSTVRTFEALTAEFELQGSSALLVGRSRETAGPSFESVLAACDSADALINLSGVLERPDLLERFAVRAYVDLDPAFNQLWHAAGIDRGFEAHTHHFTVGAAIGHRGCEIPTCGAAWTHTLPPVVLSRWRPIPLRSEGPLTTVANWRSYGSIDSGGVFYGQKAHSLRSLCELPRRSHEQFVLALAIDPDEATDVRALNEGGWELADPRRVAHSPAAYRDFIAGSRAELGVAKQGYVTARCGWFSDRSACYLASGRPVVAQDTGFGEVLPVGEGLLKFADADDALAALEELEADYAGHCAAAREVAEAHLDSRVVLARLIGSLGA
jgi:hypothetical protein